MKVLVVDDSAVMRKVLMDALLKAGIQNVGQASNGKAAVAAVMEGNFDLILMEFAPGVITYRLSWLLPNQRRAGYWRL